MEHGMLEQNDTVGQIGTGQNGTIPFNPQRCFILPQCPGARFTNDFLPAIQIRWKLSLAVIPL